MLRPDVLVQIRLQRKRPLAIRASEWPLFRVNPQMRLQIERPRKPLLADRTNVHLRLGPVRFHMRRQRRFHLEPLSAIPTRVAAEVAMHVLVALQRRDVLKVFPARAAWIRRQF